MDLNDENLMLDFAKEIKEQVEAMNEGYTSISIEALHDLVVASKVIMIGGVTKEEIVSPDGTIPKDAYVTVKPSKFNHGFLVTVDYRCIDGAGETITIEEVPIEQIKIQSVY